jgi:hypothetical protein
MATKGIEHRRKVRAIEARRDKLMEASQKARAELAKTRVELKHMRRGR